MTGAGGGRAPHFSFDARRWTQREQIVGAATLVLLISLFLPWFGIIALRAQVAESFGLDSASLWFALVVIVAIAVLLALRAGLDRVPFAAPPGDRQLLAGAAWLNFLLVLATFLIKPAVQGRALPPGVVSVGWLAGAYLGLAAAAVAAAVSVLPRLPQPPAGGWRRPSSGGGRAGDPPAAS